MKLYSNLLFPFFYDKLLKNEHLSQSRQDLISNSTGKTLEVGIGTGQNLVFYPHEIKEIWAIDPNPGMKKQLDTKLGPAITQVHFQHAVLEELPFEDNSFDTVVSTLVLCSVKNIEKSLNEIKRVLKPEGKFLFLEHGKSSDEKAFIWQKRISPCWKHFGDGCQLHIDMEERVRGHLKIETLQKFQLEKAPEIFGFIYLGIATKK